MSCRHRGSSAHRWKDRSQSLCTGSGQSRPHAQRAGIEERTRSCSIRGRFGSRFDRWQQPSSQRAACYARVLVRNDVSHGSEAERYEQPWRWGGQVFVRIPNGKTTIVVIKNHQNIQDLKNEIYLTSWTPAEYNTLLLNGKDARRPKPRRGWRVPRMCPRGDRQTQGRILEPRGHPAGVLQHGSSNAGDARGTPQRTQ